MEQMIIMLIIIGMAFLAGYATGYCTGVERKLNERKNKNDVDKDKSNIKLTFK